LVRREAGDLKPFGRYARHAAQLTQVASLVLEGRAAMLDNQPKVAAKAFRKAADIDETRLAEQTDPPLWWYPIRRSLAAALLVQGDAEGAMREARAALVKRPSDPVSLDILAQAERRLGLIAEADAHLAQARKGWAGDLSTLTLAQS
jgi:predicted Zn-dependent protease